MGSWLRTDVEIPVSGGSMGLPFGAFCHLYGEILTLDYCPTAYKDVKSDRLKTYKGNVGIEENVF